MAIDVSPIQRFMQRVAKMATLKQNDIRLTMAEATELSASLAAVLASHVAQPPALSAPVATSIDGGSLKS